MRGSSQQRSHFTLKSLRVLVGLALMGLPVLRSGPAQAAGQPTAKFESGDDEWLNAAEIAAGVVISGQADPDVMLSIEINDADGTTPTIAFLLKASPTGAYATAPLNLSGLKDGMLNVEVYELINVANQVAYDTATAVEESGDISVELIERVGPVVSETAVDATHRVGGDVSSTGDAGAEVVAQVDPTAGQTVADASHQAGGQIGTAGDQGAELTAQVGPVVGETVVEATHQAGGPIRAAGDASADFVAPGSAAGTDTVQKDTIAPLAPTIDVSGAQDGYLNTVESAAVVVSGKTDPSAKVHLEIRNNLGAALREIEVEADSNGNWTTGTTEPLDLSALPDGGLLFVATATDPAGNIGTVPGILPVIKDTTKPAILTMDFAEITEDNQLDNAEIQDVTISGTTSEPRAVVTVEVDNVVPAGQKHVRTVTSSAGGPLGEPPYTFSVDDLDLRNLQPGTIVAKATPTDTAGNPGDVKTVTILNIANAPPVPAGVEIIDNDPRYPDGYNGQYDEIASIKDTEAGQALKVVVAPVGATPSESFVVSLSVDDNNPETPASVATDTVLTPGATLAARTFSLKVVQLDDGPIKASVTVRRQSDGGYMSSSDTSTLDLHGPRTTWTTANGTVFLGNTPGAAMLAVALGTLANVLKEGVPPGGGGTRVYYDASGFVAALPPVYDGNIVLTGTSEDTPATSPLQFVVITADPAPDADPASNAVIRTAMRSTNGPKSDWSLQLALGQGTWLITARAQDEGGNLEAVGSTISITVL